MKHEFDADKQSLYEYFKFSPLLLLVAVISTVVFFLIFGITSNNWWLMPSGLFLILFLLRFCMPRIVFFKGIRSAVFVECGRIVYRKYRIVHGRSGVHYIDYQIHYATEKKWRRDFSISVRGDFDAQYIYADGESVHHTENVKSITIPPIFTDMEGIWDAIEARLDPEHDTHDSSGTI